MNLQMTRVAVQGQACSARFALEAAVALGAFLLLRARPLARLLRQRITPQAADGRTALNESLSDKVDLEPRTAFLPATRPVLPRSLHSARHEYQPGGVEWLRTHRSRTALTSLRVSH